MAAYTTDTITPKHHDALVAWQKKHFPELEFLQDNWSKYYNQTPFQLFAKIGKLASENISYGRMTGQPRFEQAGDMVGNMFYTARDIIRAQASTELGSIQQHRLTLEEAPTDQMKMAVLRIMAEELRHGYQMFWVFDHDKSWKKPGHPDVAQDTIDELLAMELGNHVLDAFNIPFRTSSTTSSSPRSSTSSASTSWRCRRSSRTRRWRARWVRCSPRKASTSAAAADSCATWPWRRTTTPAATRSTRSSACSTSGSRAAWRCSATSAAARPPIAFGFKDRNNGTAQSEYYNEVREVLELVNVDVVQHEGEGHHGPRRAKSRA